MKVIAVVCVRETIAPVEGCVSGRLFLEPPAPCLPTYLPTYHESERVHQTVSQAVARDTYYILLSGMPCTVLVSTFLGHERLVTLSTRRALRPRRWESLLQPAAAVRHHHGNIAHTRGSHSRPSCSMPMPRRQHGIIAIGISDQVFGYRSRQHEPTADRLDLHTCSRCALWRTLKGEYLGLEDLRFLYLQRLRLRRTPRHLHGLNSAHI